jgi:intracellular multiplication protein IcmG
MVNEKDEKYEGQDEGEYHFSDDQVTYEADTETVKAHDATAVVKESPLAQLNKYRRVIIAVVVFFVLMFIVYKMLAPNTSSTPPTDFSQQAIVQPKPRVAVETTTKTMQPPAGIVQQNLPAAPVVQAAAVAPPIPQQAPIGLPPATTPVVQTSVPPPISSVSQMPPPMVVQDAGKEIGDRLGNLEQQNAKLANVLQIEYAQKMSDYETQSAATQAKLQDLSKRVANIEAALSQITQLLQEGGKQVSAAGLPPARVAEPKQIYTVQAIIPGRAWLKSDVGDTVTVAEGDILRDYGRVTKIDPYDGVVVIDTGNKVISLSYGAGNDS